MDIKKIKAVFGDKVINKGQTRLQDLQEFPRYVVEYLIDNFCKEETFEKDIIKVKSKLIDQYATPREAEKLKHKIKQSGETPIIAKCEVRLNPQEDKYWASLSALNEKYINIPDVLIERYPKLFGGMWGVVTLKYDSTIIWKGKTRPFVIVDITPFQVARIYTEEYIDGRKEFSTDEWLDFLFSTIGLNPESFSKREKLITLLRLIPLVEKFVNMIELGPRETGKSYIFKNLSYYVYMLSGGKATRASLFIHLGTGKPGLVSQFDSLVFDEIAHTKFTDPLTTISVFKDYMEYGSFSIGKHTVIGESSIVMIGNIDVVAGIPHEKYYHLFNPLPEELQDTAFIDRIHGFIPGWEIPKLKRESFSNDYGFVMDYFAELLHNLRNLDPISNLNAKYQLLNASSRDDKAISKLLRGIIKLMHPDGKIKDEELFEYLLIVTELRQRIKDQLHLMAPGEYSNVTIEFSVNGLKGKPKLKERQREFQVKLPSSPSIGKVIGLSVSGNNIGMIQIFEVIASKGNGGLFPLGNMGKVMKESLKTAYEYISHNRKKFNVDVEFKDGYDISVLAVQMAIPKEGPSSGLAFLVGMISALSKKLVRCDTALTGEITLHGEVLPVGAIPLKIFSAIQAGCKRVIIPEGNRKEAENLPEDLRSIQILFVSKVDEALKELIIGI